MSGEAFGFDDDSDEVVPEEWPTFYTPVPVWVLLCGCSAQAYRMYAFLAEHINNRTPGKRIAFPSQKAVARAMNLKDYRDVAKYREELAALGAIRFEEFRYAGGMRRRYRYWVRFNPPEGYTGLLSLTDFYEANPDVKARKSKSVKDKAQGETAGQRGGGKIPTSGGGGKPTARGGKSPTAQQLDQAQPDPVQREDADAPSGRSPVGGRSPSTSGSREAEGEGGFAASGKTSSSPTPKDDTCGPVAGTTKSGIKKAAHSREQLDTVRRVRAFFPPELLDHGLPDLPVLSDAILTAMGEGRTVEQLRDRIWFRWVNHGFKDIWAEEKAFDSPVGVAVALVRPLRRGDRFACPDLRCENGADVDTKEPCRLCAERLADWRAERARKRGQKLRQGANSGPAGAGSAEAALPPQRAAQDVPTVRDDAAAELDDAVDVATEGLPWWEVEAARYEQTLAAREQRDTHPAPAPF
ncbi:hypothetical protein [Streptomyces rubiginosohelvolus]|uniref:Uncharacterized protein n=1 Tax=Streptomyces rubiginosohelvolus TaxID=67362 RepID=A0ABQ3CE95_9ACTN|nr:hypothetical protein [Streptomyces pluricolorescens]GGZ82804.1 hypothetical protein GCM10010328_66530 [Streptomyces pluricolorescens]